MALDSQPEALDVLLGLSVKCFVDDQAHQVGKQDDDRDDQGQTNVDKVERTEIAKSIVDGLRRVLERHQPFSNGHRGTLKAEELKIRLELLLRLSKVEK